MISCLRCTQLLLKNSEIVFKRNKFCLVVPAHASMRLAAIFFRLYTFRFLKIYHSCTQLLHENCLLLTQLVIEPVIFYRLLTPKKQQLKDVFEYNTQQYRQFMLYSNLELDNAICLGMYT